ncbi:uncharacterized protein LOC124265660 [Haliotis rubra]|uniref:uncharacterized protein LOC124265660 n=1 Tax=Haliotis rubra TaxID=36100 RepID=UPI001EE62103|nr:uncharacterized protein LOC124265660 [Haliotis rubra]XP_046556415.1 uncharacterized protein LOC124265660 [Haliotis rubra]XP_046556416.1 uncharacterized protein LOC124265660 [Haliotis rubra]
MNIVFPPEKNWDEAKTTMRTPIQVNTITVNAAMFTHYLLIGSFLLIPAMFHIAEQQRSKLVSGCSYILMAVTSGSLLSFIFGVAAMVLTQIGIPSNNICSCYVNCDIAVLVFLVVNIVLYNITTGHVKKCTVTGIVLSWNCLAVVSWAVFAVGVQTLSQNPHGVGFNCVSRYAISLPFDVHIYMPVFSGRQDSTTLVVLNALVYVPPSLIILVCGIIRPFSDPYIPGALPKRQNECTTCQRTLRIFHSRTWIFFFILILCILRPIWLLNNWFRHHDYSDIAPAIPILILFYPINIAQFMNFLSIHYSKGTTLSQIYHI